MGSAGDSDRPLDVLHVVESLGHGGAEQNLLSISRRMPRARFRQHLAWLDDEDILLERFRPHMASMFRVPPAGGTAGQALALARWMRAHKPDVVHTQLVRAQLVTRAAALLAGRPPVVTTWQSVLYTPEAVSSFGSPRRLAFLRLLDRLTCPLSSHFIAVSETVATHCSAQLHIPPARISVVHNAVEPMRYAETAAPVVARLRAELGLADRDRVLLTVGRLIRAKAQNDIVAAMPEVLRHHPRAVLIVAGQGPLDEELRAQIDGLALGDRVRLLGSRTDVPVLLRLADLFLLPSQYEGLSVALIEALASGLPAVVSDIRQNREAAGTIDTVRFVRPGDVPAFAAAMIAALDEGEPLRARARDGGPIVQQRFSPTDLAARVGAVLAEAAAR